MAPPPSLVPQFPDKDVFGRALFEEGIRHLEDARVLYEAGRHPAAIASAMKSAELAVKAIVVLDGAMGWWDKIFSTHSPLTDIKSHPVLQRHIDLLESYQRGLVAAVGLLESLAPGRPGAKGSGAKSFDIGTEKNPEYPFFSYSAAPATGVRAPRLDKPSSYFGEAESKNYYNVARNTMAAAISQYPAVRQWGLALPAPLT